MGIFFVPILFLFHFILLFAFEFWIVDIEFLGIIEFFVEFVEEVDERDNLEKKGLEKGENECHKKLALRLESYKNPSFVYIKIECVSFI